MDVIVPEGDYPRLLSRKAQMKRSVLLHAPPLCGLRATVRLCATLAVALMAIRAIATDYRAWTFELGEDTDWNEGVWLKWTLEVDGVTSAGTAKAKVKAENHASNSDYTRVERPAEGRQRLRPTHRRLKR
jgi:hypothetical protein